MHASIVPDTLLSLFKYPIGLGSLWFASLVIQRIEAAPFWSQNPQNLICFFGGAIGSVVIWTWIWRRNIFLRYLATLEHELTHAIFAVITFHRIQAIEVSATKGGRCTFVGKGNWLIALAPYFFPTFPLVLWLILPAETLTTELSVLLGLVWGIHLGSTIRQIHRHQTDFRQAGLLFSLMFLPSAWLLSQTALLTITLGDVKDLSPILEHLHVSLIRAIGHAI